jgi:putative endonuclease
MFYLYILKSKSSERYYIGSTRDLKERLRRHNRNAEKGTKGRGPWVIVYSESFINRSGAVQRERQVKSYKGGREFKKLIFGE